jgi:hypothetical protein
MARSSGHLENVNMQADKLFIRAEVASQDLKNRTWNEIKKIDPRYADLYPRHTLPYGCGSATDALHFYVVHPTGAGGGFRPHFRGEQASVAFLTNAEAG